MWDVVIIIEPPWSLIGLPGHACEYEKIFDSIEIRYSSEKSTAESCLPHEFSHRWQDLLKEERKHNDSFYEKQDLLYEAMLDTWLNR